MIAKSIVFAGHHCILMCDAKCHKAWGMNNRPQLFLQDSEQKVYGLNGGSRYPDDDAIDLDDSVYLADGELGDAPADPGTYEGGEAKPQSPEQRLNKWCARECERSVKVDDGEDFELPNLSRRFYNIEPHYRDE